MIRRAVGSYAVAALALAGCGAATDQAGVVATDAPLQQLDIRTVPPETVPTTIPPTNPPVENTAGGASPAEPAENTDPGGGEAVPESTEAGKGCTYTVVAGDTPIKIARKTGVTVDAFLEANQASGVLDQLLIGSKVVIPPPGSC